MHPVQELDELIRYCLFKEEELPGQGRIPDGAVLVEGLTGRFYFHPIRLKEIKSKVKALIKNLVQPSFFTSQGGGMSFLKLVEAKDGTIWGEQRSANVLLCLAVALNEATILVPRHLWYLFPGGVPYIRFNDQEADETAAVAAT